MTKCGQEICSLSPNGFLPKHTAFSVTTDFFQNIHHLPFKTTCTYTMQVEMQYTPTLQNHIFSHLLLVVSGHADRLEISAATSLEVNVVLSALKLH